jgi:hypothetical protein
LASGKSGSKKRPPEQGFLMISGTENRPKPCFFAHFSKKPAYFCIKNVSETGVGGDSGSKKVLKKRQKSAKKVQKKWFF